MLVRGRNLGCAGLLVAWLLSGAVVWATAELLPGMHVRGFGSALVVALVLGFLNAIVRPVLVVLTLPITVVTLGLFLIVVNAAVLGLAAWLLPGFAIAGFGTAVIATVVLTIFAWAVNALLDRFEGRREARR